MKRVLMAALMVAAVMAVAGCGADVSKQIATNEQMRTQVFDAIAADQALAGQVVDKLMASDSTRIAIVDKMLTNDEVSKQVIVRVAMNPDAINMVIGTAVQDSAMRGHVMTLLKGIEMGSRKK